MYCVATYFRLSYFRLKTMTALYCNVTPGA